VLGKVLRMGRLGLHKIIPSDETLLVKRRLRSFGKCDG
jgi:hypothetical protein